WQGSAEETAAAVELDCYFSVNGAQARHGLPLGMPADRLLTETDYPYTRDRDAAAAAPGAVTTAEHLLAETWGTTWAVVRRQVWRNLHSLVTGCSALDLMPARLRELVEGASQ